MTRHGVLAAALLLVAAPGRSAAQPAATAPGEAGRAGQRILVHITRGPEDPTRAALGFAVAKAALDEGHAVSIFLAGDAVQLLREPVLSSLVGLGTGKLRELHDAIVAKGGRFYLSAGSSAARGVTEQELAGRRVELAGPPQLVRLALAHDRLFTY